MQENNEIKYLKLEDIIPNRLQPRTEFDEEKLNELANSIKQYGIINPLIVRIVGNKYEIIAGERRYKAAGIAGLNKVPVIVSNMDDNTSAEIAVIENIQRQNLTTLEEARSYRKLLDQGNITQEQLAQKMGKTQSTIANKMRLLNLCDEVQDALENNQISERHARTLLQLKNIDDQREMLEKIIKDRMTVKTTENAIKEKLQSKTLNSNNEIIEDNIVPSQTLSENIYGNDVVNIMELNKKELEKENDNMNNNEQNIQMNPGVVPTPPTPPVAPTAPAFGDRFFPSLEDQETNINLTNPFETPAPVPTPSPAPVAQPMMENLVDTTLTTPPTPPVAPVQPEPVINIPSFVTNNQTVPTINDQVNTLTSTNEINLPPMFDVQPQNPEPIVAPIPQNELTPEIPIPTIETPTTVEPNVVAPIAEPIINPIENKIPEVPNAMPVVEVAPEPVLQPIQSEPVVEQPVSITQQPEIIVPPVEAPVTMPVVETPTMEPIVSEAVVPAQPAPLPTLENKTTDNIINAINALKNLGLSIEAIGYKTTIQEEDTPNTYKITIELEK